MKMKRVIGILLSIVLVLGLISGMSLTALAISTSVFAESEEWTCPNCGNVTAGNFCNNCGEQKPNEEWTCPNCGLKVTGNFCMNCGTARPEGRDAAVIESFLENKTEVQETALNGNSWENNLLMEEHGALGELNADGNVPEAKEYVFDNPNWKRSEIEGIYILNTKQNMPADAVDVSGGKDGTVMAWLDEYKHLYIAGEGGVRVSENASALFAWFENVKEIHFDGNLHTDFCNNMSHMFYHCLNLMDLNLDGINTGNVMNMTKMFTACSSLPKLDVSQLETSKVESFYATFQKCSSLEELSLTNFDTSMANNMALMFADCTNLKSIVINPQSFKTDLVETMSYMFDGCEALCYVNMAGFNTHSVKRTNYMFRDCKSFEMIFLENHDFSSIEEHEGMFQGAFMEAYYGTNGEKLFMTDSSEMQSTFAFTSEEFELYSDAVDNILASPYGEYATYCQVDLNNDGVLELIISQLDDDEISTIDKVFTIADGTCIFAGYFYGPNMYYETETGEGIYAIGTHQGYAYEKVIRLNGNTVSSESDGVLIDWSEYENDNPIYQNKLVNYYDEQILPESDDRYLTEEEIQYLDDIGLELAKNEIYARHGRIFVTPYIDKYFRKQSWYSPSVSPEEFSDSVFNVYEAANIALIVDEEEKIGGVSEEETVEERQFTNEELLQLALMRFGSDVALQAWIENDFGDIVDIAVGKKPLSDNPDIWAYYSVDRMGIGTDMLRGEDVDLSEYQDMLNS